MPEHASQVREIEEARHRASGPATEDSAGTEGAVALLLRERAWSSDHPGAAANGAARAQDATPVVRPQLRGIHPAQVLHMQRLAGNRATLQALGHLTVSRTTDTVDRTIEEQLAGTGAPTAAESVPGVAGAAGAAAGAGSAAGGGIQPPTEAGPITSTGAQIGSAVGGAIGSIVGAGDQGAALGGGIGGAVGAGTGQVAGTALGDGVGATATAAGEAAQGAGSNGPGGGIQQAPEGGGEGGGLFGSLGTLGTIAGPLGGPPGPTAGEATAGGGGAAPPGGEGGGLIGSLSTIGAMLGPLGGQAGPTAGEATAGAAAAAAGEAAGGAAGAAVDAEHTGSSEVAGLAGAGPGETAGHAIAGEVGAGAVAGAAGAGPAAAAGAGAAVAAGEAAGHAVAGGAGAGAVAGAAGAGPAATAGEAAGHMVAGEVGAGAVAGAAGAGAAATAGEAAGHAVGGGTGARHAVAGGGGVGGGGLGGGGSAAETEEIPEVAEPGAVATGPIGALAQPAPAMTEPPAEEAGEPATEEPPALEGQAAGIESQAQGGGGILDAIVNSALALFQPITSRIGSGVRSAASSVTNRVRSIFTEAVGFAKTVVSTIVSGVKTLAGGILGEIRTHLAELKSGVRGIVSTIFGAVRNVAHQVGGALRGAIAAILRGQPVLPTLLAPIKAIFSGLFGDVTGRITAVIERIRSAVNGAIDRLVQAAAQLALRIQEGVTWLGAKISEGIAWLGQEIDRVLQMVSGFVNELPGILRNAISGIVNKVLSFVRRVVAGILSAAQAFVQRAVGRVVAFITNLMRLITRGIEFVRNLVRRVVDLVVSAVRAVSGAMAAVKNWLIEKAKAALARILRAVLMPIVERLRQRVIKLIGPAVAAAIRQAQLMFPNGLPAPGEIVTKAQQAATQLGAEAEDEVLRGLTNPEGDHLSYGISLGASGGEAVGGGVSGSMMFDIVLDYRRNEIGFFVSPGESVQGNLGDVSGMGALSDQFAWGTVASFGDTSSDVLSAYGGWFTNVTYGVQAGGAYGVGLGASSGGSFYRGGSIGGVPILSYSPIGADSHPAPGTGTPGTTTPGTPDTPGTMALGDVLFPRQVSDVGATPGGPAAVDNAADLVRDYPTSHPRGDVRSIDVLGEASRVWRHPGAGRTRAEENADLAETRAENVASALRPKVAVPVTAHGNGDLRAAAAGKADTDASPEDQRASMVASTLERGTPGTTTPGTPPTMERDKFTIEAGAIPFPFKRRQTWGWDTTLGVTAYGGEGAKAGVYGGLGISYSFPIGKARLDADTMKAIRITVGIMKLTADVMTLSPLGFIRDALGLAAMSSEVRSVEDEIIRAIESWTIELPPGSAVA